MSLIPLNSTLLERLRSMKVEESEEKEKKDEGRGPHLRKPPAIVWSSTSKEVVIPSLGCGRQRGGANAPPRCIRFYQIRLAQALRSYDKPLQERRSAP
jgi:hypothetical protein